MRSSRSKWMTGVAGLAGIAVLGMPALNGMILEGRLQNEFVNLAEQNDFHVESLSVERGYSSTELSVNLEGTGLRKVNGQGIVLSGSLQHGSLFSAPGIVSGDLDVSYHIYEQGVRIDMPGTITGTMSLNGSVDARITYEGFELPLDPGAQLTLDIAPSEGQLNVSRSGHMVADMKPASWTLLESNEPLIRMDMSASTFEFNGSEQSWSMTIPEVSYTAPFVSTDVLMVVDQFLAEGQQFAEGEQLSSQVSLTTGPVSVPFLAEEGLDSLIEETRMRSRVENLDRAVIERIPELLGRGDSENTLSGEEAAQWLVDVVATQPRMVLEELSVQTTKGRIALAFDMAGTEKTAEFVQRLIDNPPQNAIEEDLMTYEAMQSLAMSASVQLSDDLIEWGCEAIPQQMIKEQGGQPAEAGLYTAMCQAMANSGEFLTLSCLQFTDPQQQQQCLTSMQQARDVWVESKTLEMALEDGTIRLNGTDLKNLAL